MHVDQWLWSAKHGHTKNISGQTNIGQCTGNNEFRTAERRCIRMPGRACTAPWCFPTVLPPHAFCTSDRCRTMAAIVAALYSLRQRSTRTADIAPGGNSEAPERPRVVIRASALTKFQQLFRKRFISVSRPLLTARLEMEERFCYEGCRLLAWITLFVLFLLSSMVTADRGAQLGVHSFLKQHLALDELPGVVTTTQMWELVAKISAQSKTILQSSEVFMKNEESIRFVFQGRSSFRLRGGGGIPTALHLCGPPTGIFVSHVL